MAAREQILNFEDPTNLKQMLLFLYGHQTMEEQGSRVTVEQNGMGFNRIDADFLSSLAQQVLRGYELSPKQLLHAKLRLPKYKRQLETNGWQSIVLPPTRAASANQQTASSIIDAANRKKEQAAASAGTLKVEKADGGKLGLAFYPNVYPSKQIKDIGFTYWLNKAWHQSRPHINATIVADVVKMFGPTVIVEPEVQQQLESAVVNLPSEIVSNTQLREYQKDTIKYQLEHPHCLVALAPRLGKTVTTIFAVQAAKCQRVLVVAPLSLLLDWKRKIKTWCSEDAAIVYKKQLPVPGRWTVTNYDTLRLHPGNFDDSWDAIIVDESLLIKNRKAVRTESVKQLLKNAKPKYLWLLSGAPVSRMFTDLWSQLNVLDPHRFSSFWRFAERYCIIERNQWSNFNLVGDQPNAAERIKHDLSDVYFYRSQEDVLDLPPWNIENIGVPMSESQTRAYLKMEEQFVADLGDGQNLMAPNVLVQMTRLIQLASNPVLIGGKDDSNKWKAAIEMLQYEQLPAIIWTNFIETADRLLEVLHLKGYKAAKLTGSESPEQRQNAVSDFQDGKLDVLVAHPAVGKFGLDLYMAKTVIFLERSFNGDDYYQALNRIRHVDAKVSPHIVQLLSELAGENGGNTIDHVIDQVLAGRRDKVRKLTAFDLQKVLQTNR